MPAKFETVRNTGLTMRADDHQQDQHGQQRHLASSDAHVRPERTAALRAARTAVRPALVAGRPVPSAGRPTRSRSSAVATSSSAAAVSRVAGSALGRHDQLVAVEGRLAEFGEDLARTRTMTRSQITRSESSSLHSSTPAPLSAVTAAGAKQQLLGGDVDAAGGRDRHDKPRLVGERPRDGDLLLVAAGQLPTGWPGPEDTSESVRGDRRRRGCPPRGPQQPSRSASRSVMVIVTFSATPRCATKPSARRSSGM